MSESEAKRQKTEAETSAAIAATAELAGQAAAQKAEAEAAEQGPAAVQGTEEWNQIRKLNHKEVERRRREAITEAIKELAELVPTAHNNKAQVIRKAAETIRKLKDQEEANVNKWTLEKIITDQAIAELASSNDKLKSELEKAYRELEHTKAQFAKFVDVVKVNGASAEINEFLSKLEPFQQKEPAPEQDEEDDEEEEEEEEKK